MKADSRPGHWVATSSKQGQFSIGTHTGYDYTYLFPGIRKVVQAEGRVIRTASDCGTVHLIDDRFARPEVLRLLPNWWTIQTASEDATSAQPSKSFADQMTAMPI